MTCDICGRPAENGRPTHWLNCPAIKGVVVAELTGANPTVGPCEHGECTRPKRPQGKGPKPKFCTEHSDPKSRK